MPHQAYRVTLPDWEGPLDLLLHVIRTHELDIPIAFVTAQYLEYLDLMRTLNLDIAAEYLEMAATLLHIKSQTLLPQASDAEEEEPEEEGDPRAELIRRLLEYQRYRDGAEQLGQRQLLGRDTFTASHVPEDAGEEPLVEIGLFELVDAFRHLLERTKVSLAHELTTERITVSERIGEIVELLVPGELIPFDLLLGEASSRMKLVVTLLALLEMTRLRMTRLMQHQPSGRLYIVLRGDGTTADTTVLDTGTVAAAPHTRDALHGRRRLRVPRTLQILRRDGRLADRRPKVLERWTHRTRTTASLLAGARSSSSRRDRRRP
jgi:segregation and condensation protein A